jgi:hypothetical protein
VPGCERVALRGRGGPTWYQGWLVTQPCQTLPPRSDARWRLIPIAGRAVVVAGGVRLRQFGCGQLQCGADQVLRGGVHRGRCYGLLDVSAVQSVHGLDDRAVGGLGGVG